MIFCIRIKLRMNIHQVLFFCFLSGATLGVNTQSNHTVTEGESVTVGCSGTVYGSRKFFCKDECKEVEDILVETEENRAQSGRYSIKYIEGSAFGLYVTITQLKKSDTGRYKYGYGRPLSPDSFYSFSIFVADAPTTEEPNWGLRPFPTSVPSASTPATTQSLTSSSGSFTPSSSFPETTEKFAAPTTEEPNWTLRPVSTSVPSASTPATTQSLTSSSAPTTEEPNWSLRPFPTSVPSASTPATTQSLISSSGSFTPSSSFPETTEQFAAVSDVSCPGYFWPLVVCVPVIIVLVAVVLLFVYKLKMRRNSGFNTRETSDSRKKELSVVYENRPPVSMSENRPPVHYENRPPVSMSEDPDYQSLDAAGMDPDQTYSTLRETINK